MFRIVIYTLIVCGLVLGIVPVAGQEPGAVFVLVHGAFQDSSGWEQLKATLEESGNTVFTVQAAGRGTDTTPLNEISLTTYRDAVVDVISAQSEPVVLVGHSFGGMVISSVAEIVPDKIHALVYLAAYLPRSGDSLVTISAQDKYSWLGQEGNFVIAEDFTTASVNKDIFAAAFCPDCDEEQARTVNASQMAEPLAPLNEVVTLTDANFGGVEKAYILTAQDVIVSPQLQALMLSWTPVARVYSVDAGHAAYITVPDQLAQILTGIAA